MDYKALTAELQTIVDKKPDRHFYRELKLIIDQLEQTDDVKVFKVTIRFKKLLMDFEDPFDWRKFEFRDPDFISEIKELTIKLIDYLNDYFGFLKPLK